MKFTSRFITLFYVCDCLVIGAESDLSLLPRERVSVCPQEQLIFTCNASIDILTWSVTVPGSGTETRIVSNTAPINVRPIDIAGITFNISRLSINGTLPLISLLSVPNTTDMNGTKIGCASEFDDNTRLQMMSTIHIIRSGADALSQPLNISSIETFSADSVAVDLEWKEESGVTYTTNIIPQAPSTSTGSSRLQLMLSYNRVYNVTITATLCGQNYGENTTLTLSYADCGIPLARNGASLLFNSTLEGSQLIFWCDESPNDIFNASCLSDGRWSIDFNQYYDNNCSTRSQVFHSLSISVILLPLMVVMGVILILLTTIIIIVVMKRRGSRSRKLQVDTGRSSQDYDATSHHVHCTLPRSEYSLVQYSPEEQQSDSKEPKSSDSRKNYLVYADIGPGSFKKSCLSTIDIQSHRVEYAQVNHGARVKSQKLESRSHDQIDKLVQSELDTLLNLDSLLIQLQAEVTPNWYQFGVAIGVEKKVLDKYQQYPPEQSIIEILDNWLRNHAGQPTWREVAEALRKVGLQKLAFDIERVYDTGKLPIEVNMNEVPQVSVSNSAEELPPPIPPRLSD